MIVAAFEEWFQNTNGHLCKEFLFDDLWSRVQPLLNSTETRGYQVCGRNADGQMLVFRDQMNRGIRYTYLHSDTYENLQYVEDVESSDWVVYVTERSSRTHGFLRTQAWWRQGVKRIAYREYADEGVVSDPAPDVFRRQVVLTMADEEGLRREALESCSLEEIEERIAIAHLRPQLAVFGQEQ